MQILSKNSSRKKQLSSNLSVLFKVYFDFAYYICFSPFRLKLANSQYSICKTKFQNVCCILSIFLNIVWFVSDMRDHSWIKGTGTRVFFKIFDTAASNYFKIVLIYALWQKQHVFRNIANFLNENYQTDSIKILGYKRVSLRVLIFGISLIYTVACLLRVVFGTIHFGNPHLIFENYAALGRFNFFLEDIAPGNCIIDIVAGLLSFIGSATRRFLGLFGDFFLSVNALVLLQACSEFSEVLKIEKDWLIIRHKYIQLVKLTDLINEGISPAITGFLAESLFYTAIVLHNNFVTRQGQIQASQIVPLLVGVPTILVVLLLCANIPYKMSALKKWLDNDSNRAKVPPELVNLILYDLETNAVSIKGSHVFPVTYSMLTSMLGITMTYFIICLQS